MATNEAFIDYALRASLMDYVDKQILIQLRDGKQIIGDLRSFDQFSNVVLTNCVERIVHNTLYADRDLGVNLVRGDTIVMMGEVDAQKEAAMDKIMQKSAYEVVHAAREQDIAARRAAGKRGDDAEAE